MICYSSAAIDTANPYLTKFFAGDSETVYPRLPRFAPYVHSEAEWGMEGATGGTLWCFDDVRYNADVAYWHDFVKARVKSTTPWFFSQWLAEWIIDFPESRTDAFVARADAAWYSPQGWTDPSIANYWTGPTTAPQQAIKLAAQLGISPQIFYTEIAPAMQRRWGEVTNPFVAQRGLLNEVLIHVGMFGDPRIQDWYNNVTAALESGGDAYVASQNSKVDIMTIARAVGWAMLPLAIGALLTAPAAATALPSLALEAPAEAAWLAEAATYGTSELTATLATEALASDFSATELGYDPALDFAGDYSGFDLGYDPALDFAGEYVPDMSVDQLATDIGVSPTEISSLQMEFPNVSLNDVYNFAKKGLDIYKAFQSAEVAPQQPLKLRVRPAATTTTTAPRATATRTTLLPSLTTVPVQRTMLDPATGAEIVQFYDDTSGEWISAPAESDVPWGWILAGGASLFLLASVDKRRRRSRY